MTTDPPVAAPGRTRRPNVVQIRLSDAGLRALDELARREERTRSDMIRVLLRRGMETQKR